MSEESGVRRGSYRVEGGGEVVRCLRCGRVSRASFLVPWRSCVCRGGADTEAAGAGSRRWEWERGEEGGDE